MANKNLILAKKKKNDEFFTRLEDISMEVVNYKDLIKDKIIYLNTDNPEFSQFFNYFNLSFDFLQLKRVIATFYNPEGNVYRTDIIRENGEKIIKKTKMEGDGDFRSKECKDILQECDIVVTNPPFSLFREFVALLEEFNKKYLIIGNMNAVTYKEIFPLIKSNKLWLGETFKDYVGYFYGEHDESYNIKQKVEGCIRVSGVTWFTNLSYKKRYERFINPVFNYYEEKGKYHNYDYYDAINLDKAINIPDHYWGNIGVPITFLNKLNPDQFDIIDSNSIRLSHLKQKNTMLIKDKESSVGGVTKYVRLLIKRKDLQKIDSVEGLKEKLKYLYDRPGGFYTLSFKTDKESLVVVTMTDDTRTTTLSIRIMSEEGETYEERLKEVLFHDFNVRECDLPFEDFYKKGEDIFNNLF